MKKALFFALALLGLLALAMPALAFTAVAVDDAYLADTNVALTVSAASGVTINDTGFNAATHQIAYSDTQTAYGGTVALSADGSFVYTPPVGFSGLDTFSYTVQTDENTSSATVSIDVQGPVTWFVNLAAAPGGNGTFGAPFQNFTPLQGANDVDAAGDRIFAYAGTYSTAITLEDRQQLIGQGSGLVLNTVTIPVGTKPLLDFAGTLITTANDNTVKGFNLDPNSTGLAYLINADNKSGLTVDNVTFMVASSNNGLFLNAVSGTVSVSNSQFDGSGSAGAVRMENTTANVSFTNTPMNLSGGTAYFDVGGGGTVLFDSASDIAMSSAFIGIWITGASATHSVTFAGFTNSANTNKGVNYSNSDPASMVTFSEGVSITGTGGILVTDGGGAGTVGGMTIGGTTSTINSGASTPALKIVGADGPINMTFASLSAISGSIIDIDGITLAASSISVASPITMVNTSQGVRIENSAADITFAGLDLGTAGARFSTAPIVMSGNSGDVNLGEVNIFTSGIAALDLTNPAAVPGVVSSTSGIFDTINGRAVTIQHASIVQPLGINLTTLNSTGSATNGITLTNTSGTFTVTGTVAGLSGGAISGSAGSPVSLTNASNVSLTKMTLSAGSSNAVSGTGVDGFSLIGSLVTTTAKGVAFDSVPLLNENNISGSGVSIDSNTFTAGAVSAVSIANYSGTLGSLNISFNTIPGTSSHAISVFLGAGAGFGAGVGFGSINNNDIDNSGGIGIRVVALSNPGENSVLLGNGTFPFTINNNDIDTTSGQAIQLQHTGSGGPTAEIAGNQTSGSGTTPIEVNIIGHPLSSVRIADNTVVGSAIGGVRGITILVDSFAGGGSATSDFIVDGNTVSNTAGSGIALSVKSNAPVVNARISDNTVSGLVGAGISYGIRVESGGASSDATLCLDITGNSSVGINTATGIGLRKEGTSQFTNEFNIVGMSGVDTPAATTLVNTNNPSGGGASYISAASGYKGCTLPF